MRIIEINDVESTNSYLKENRVNYKHGDCLFTNNQTKGRGQTGNSWVSEPNKNITAGLLIKWHNLKPSEAFSISKFVAIGILSQVKKILPNEKIEIKWPNDIYINNKKVGGILIENILTNTSIEYSIIGFGLNINQTKFPNSIANKATSFKLVSNKEYKIKNVLLQITDSILDEYNKGSIHFKRLLDTIYFKNLYQKNLWCKYKDRNGEFLGKIIDVNANGKLIVEKENGSKSIFDIKEIIYF